MKYSNLLQTALKNLDGLMIDPNVISVNNILKERNYGDRFLVVDGEEGVRNKKRPPELTCNLLENGSGERI